MHSLKSVQDLHNRGEARQRYQHISFLNTLVGTGLLDAERLTRSVSTVLFMWQLIFAVLGGVLLAQEVDGFPRVKDTICDWVSCL